MVSTNKTLEISAVRPENGGLYTCSATNILAGNQQWTDTGTVNLLVECEFNIFLNHYFS